MSEIIVIDGDNVLRSLGLVRGQDLSAAEEFLQKVELVAAQKDWEVTMVCDGPQRFYPRESGLLMIQYARPKQTADTVIERMVYETKERMSVVVVTRDRAVGNLISGMGARVWSPERFRQEVG